MAKAVAAKAKSTGKIAANAAGPAMSLREMQDAFQRAVQYGNEDILAGILDNSRTTRQVLFGVYRHAYAARLIEILRSDHPLLLAYLGDEAFAEIGRRYVAERPSRHQNARWFSRDLPAFIGEAKFGGAEVAELAHLERMVNDAFDAPDAPVLAIADLAAIAPEDWATLTFVPHPSTQHIEIVTNAYAIWVALKDDDAVPEPRVLENPECITAWRRDVTPAMRRMGGEEAMMWNEANKGVSFGALCELVAVYDDPDNAALRAAQYLQGWINAGLLSEAKLPAASGGPRAAKAKAKTQF